MLPVRANVPCAAASRAKVNRKNMAKESRQESLECSRRLGLGRSPLSRDVNIEHLLDDGRYRTIMTFGEMRLSGFVNKNNYP
jgi:hypothetical protein